MNTPTTDPLDAFLEAGPSLRDITANCIAADLIEELQAIVSEAATAALLGVPEASDTACRYARDTAQGIVWTQAYRLTVDRLNDAADEAGR